MIDYTKKLKYHYRPKKGWVNDPNGLVYFNGYYHVFHQHAPDHEIPWQQPMHWGHARTKDFLNWEELPVALYPDKDYDVQGCYSGTAIVKDDTLYLFYASVERRGENKKQRISIAYSKDGIHFEKYAGNPVIDRYPKEGGINFRDPAICCIDGVYYCVVATGNEESKTGRLLLYKSDNLFSWQYLGVMSEWQNCRYTECPSFMRDKNGKFLLTASVCPLDKPHYFCVMYGSFLNDKFEIEQSESVDRGPDGYAGQVFYDNLGRCILISWLPGWRYSGYTDRDIGCMSVPREITLQDGVIRAYPVKEVQHLLKDSDPSVKITDSGFIIEREGRDPVVHEGEIRDLKIIRDEYIVEVYINGGEAVYSALL